MVVDMWVVALAVAGSVGMAYALTSSGRRVRRADRLNAALETRVAERTRELRLALEAADDQGRRLEHAIRARSDFLADMGHELRTPLNAILGFSDLLRMNAGGEVLTHRQAQAVDHIREAGRRLHGMVEAVLDLARADPEQTPIVLETTDPLLILRQVCAQAAVEAETAGVDLVLPRPTSGLAIRTDKTRLRQVLVNVVARAVAGAGRGGLVMIDATREWDRMVIEVRDTGAADPSDGDQTPGLTLAHRLARSIQATLELDTQPDGGARARLILPAQGGEMEPRMAPAVPTLAVEPIGGRAPVVLHIQSDPIQATLMRRLFDAFGTLQLHTADTGQDGLTLARDLRPDLIILDMQVAGLSGWRTRAALADDPLTEALPVLAVSDRPAPMTSGHRGFVGWLVRPVAIPDLARTLERLLSRPDARRKGRA